MPEPFRLFMPTITSRPERLRLPLEFDVSGLVEDLGLVGADEWVPHFNVDVYEGEWSGLALRSVGGHPDQIYPDHAQGADYQDTERLLLLPHLKAALDVFECPLTSVRLLSLAPGAEIREHRDYALGYDDGEVRLHVPVVTAPGVEFALNGVPVEMGVGECWYLNVNFVHRAVNRSPVRRVHLVLDCRVNDWLTGLFDEAVADPTA